MIGSSEIIQENALEHKKKKPVLSANQASNNWALGVMCLEQKNIVCWNILLYWKTFAISV